MKPKKIVRHFSDLVRKQRNEIKNALDITYELAIDDELRFKETLQLLNDLLKMYDCFIDNLESIE